MNNRKYRSRPILNPDKTVVAEVREALKRTGGHCPCVIEGSRNNTTLCMCDEFRTKLVEGGEGPCHCGLYIAVGD